MNQLHIVQLSQFFKPSNIVLLSSQDKHSPVPIIATTDPVDRAIEFTPTKAPYDPRWMLAGRPHPCELHDLNSKASSFEI